MTSRGLERLVTGGVGAAALTGALGTAWLLAHATVPDWLLPAAALGGAAIAFGVGPRGAANADGGERAPRWLRVLVLVVVAALVTTLVHGALATPSRQWDGAVAWDLKAAVLAATPTLEQPFFRDAVVFCHSRDYPLLQPLLLALLERWHLPARLVFPAAYALLVAAVALGARADAVRGSTAVLVTLAAALTPMWLSTGGGGFDSGYGDALLTTWLAVVALGAVTANLPLLACGLVLTVLQKPEGLPYAGLFLIVAWLRGEPRLLRAATVAIATGGALAVALQRDLQGFGHASPVTPVLAAAAGAGCVWIGDLVLRRCGASRRGRWLTLLAGLLPAAAGLALWCGSGDGTLGAHFADATRPLQRLQRLPQIVLAIGEWAFGRGPFGLLFVLAVVAGVARWRSGRGLRSPLLLGWLLLALPVWCVPFLTSPIDDLDQHLRATLPRVMLHWTGVSWLWTAAQLGLDPGRQHALGSHPTNP